MVVELSLNFADLHEQIVVLRVASVRSSRPSSVCLRAEIVNQRDLADVIHYE